MSKYNRESQRLRRSGIDVREISYTESRTIPKYEFEGRCTSITCWSSLASEGALKLTKKHGEYRGIDCPTCGHVLRWDRHPENTVKTRHKAV